MSITIQETTIAHGHLERIRDMVECLRMREWADNHAGSDCDVDDFSTKTAIRNDPLRVEGRPDWYDLRKPYKVDDAVKPVEYRITLSDDPGVRICGALDGEGMPVEVRMEWLPEVELIVWYVMSLTVDEDADMLIYAQQIIGSSYYEYND